MAEAKDIVTIGEDGLDAALFFIGLACPLALPVIAMVKMILPLVETAAPVIITAIKNGESPFAAAEAASPGLGGQIATLAERIPVDAKLSSAISHLDHVTMLLVAKVTPGFAVHGWTDDETQSWLDRASGPSGSQVGSA